MSTEVEQGMKKTCKWKKLSFTKKIPFTRIQRKDFLNKNHGIPRANKKEN